MSTVECLFLSRRDVESLELGVPEVVQAVEQSLLEHAAGTYEMEPKIGVHPRGTHPANFIHAMPAYLRGMQACGMKWVSGFAQNHLRGLPNVMGVQIYNDVDTGAPLAIVDCSFLTGLRTAAVSAIAARVLARPAARALAIAGCGFQGRMHLRFLTELLPAVDEVRLLDVRADAAQALADHASSFFGGRIRVAASNEECVDGADVIVTCTHGDHRIIERKEWMHEGSIGVGIEGGCAYSAEALHAADKLVVDDVALCEYFERIGRDRLTADGRPDPEFPGGLPTIHATLGEILAGTRPGRSTPRERIVAIPIGMALCDIGVTKLVYERALARSVGRRLELA
jgi:N-[(2S)-2-amino-2-carboxyethyl]-L-glutamate dehydrogenase